MGELKELPIRQSYRSPVRVHEKNFHTSVYRVPFIVTRIDIERVEIRFSVPGILNMGSGIVRDGEVPYMVDPKTGEKHVESYDIRKYCMPLSEHIDRLYQANGRWLTYGGISIGDLLMNEGYSLISWDSDLTGKSEIFYRLKTEDRLIEKNPRYFGFLISPYKVEPRDVEFEISGNNTPQLKDGRPENATYLLMGPPVVWKGKPISTTGKARWMSADLRHNLLLVQYEIGGKNVLSGEHELRSSRQLLRRALNGEAVSFLLDEKGRTLSDEEIDRVRQSAEKAGYIEVDNPLKVRFAGDYCISENKDLTIKFYSSKYSWGFLGIDSSGRNLVHILIPGLNGGRCSLEDAIKIIRHEGIEYCIATDQGGDPQTMFRGYCSPSQFWRSRITAGMIITAPRRDKAGNPIPKPVFETYVEVISRAA